MSAEDTRTLVGAALIAGARERAAKATTGPMDVHRFDNEGGSISWQIQQSADPSAVVCEISDADSVRAREDATFFARARTDVPALCDLAEQRGREIERLTAERDAEHERAEHAHDMLDGASVLLPEDLAYLWEEQAPSAAIRVMLAERAKDRAAFEEHVRGLDGDKAHLNAEVKRLEAEVLACRHAAIDGRYGLAARASQAAEPSVATVTADRIGDWMQTFTGRQFWPLDPCADEVCIEDIAHALAHQCRFAGHTRAFYSVAEHSVRVSDYLLETLRPMLGDAVIEVALWGLLHDASEAYLVDLPRPVKRQASMLPYREAEVVVTAAIAQAFGLQPRFDHDPRVKHADVILLATEARDLMSRPPNAWEAMPAPLRGLLVPWSPADAEHAFMGRFLSLSGGAR